MPPLQLRARRSSGAPGFRVSPLRRAARAIGSHADDALLIAGSALLVWGVLLVSQALALVLAGLLCVGAALVLASPPRQS
jgi:hypothetical protein